MNLNFEVILFYLTLGAGIIVLFDMLFLAPGRKKRALETGNDTMPLVIDYARSFFPVLIVVFLLRSFLYEPFRIPTGSLKPTLLVGDFILVNKFDYGLRLPILRSKIYKIGEPQRGDVIVFHYPLDPSVYYIKRVIGVPGDKISYINKTLYVNGKESPQQFVKYAFDNDEYGNKWRVEQKEENFLGIKHAIYQIPFKLGENFYDLVVPQDMYFAMGDNRDDSVDSRAWGFVPEKNIVGKATRIWMSWDGDSDWLHKIRWDRIGKAIK